MTRTYFTKLLDWQELSTLPCSILYSPPCTKHTFFTFWFPVFPPLHLFLFRPLNGILTRPSSSVFPQHRFPSVLYYNFVLSSSDTPDLEFLMPPQLFLNSAQGGPFSYSSHLYILPLFILQLLTLLHSSARPSLSTPPRTATPPNPPSGTPSSVICRVYGPVPFPLEVSFFLPSFFGH